MHRTMHNFDVISSVSRSSECTKSLAAGASPQTPLGELTTLLQTQLGLKGPNLRPLLLRRREEIGKEEIRIGGAKIS